MSTLFPTPENRNDASLEASLQRSNHLRALLSRYAPWAERMADPEQSQLAVRALAEYAAGAIHRPTLEAEQQLLDGLLGAFGSRMYGFRVALHLVERFAALTPPPSASQWAELSMLTHKIASQSSASSQRGSLEALTHLCPAIPDATTWTSLARSVALGNRSKGSVLRILRASQAWQSNAPHAGSARAALCAYVLAKGTAPSQIAQLVNLRPQHASPASDQLRVVILRAEAAPNTETSFDRTRLALELASRLDRLEKVRAGILADAARLIQSLEDNPPALRSLTLGASKEREEDLVSFFPMALRLVNAGASIAFLPPAIITRVASIYLSHATKPDLQRNIIRFISSLSVFAERLVGGPNEEYWLANFVGTIDSLLRRQENGMPIRGQLSSEARRIFEDEAHLRKLCLVLEGRGLPHRLKIRRTSELEALLTELVAHSYVQEILYTKSDSRREHLKRIFASNRVAGADNPPFSVQTTPEADQVRFMSQITRTYRHQIDSYYGFWAHTFAFRHSPISRRCSFDEMAQRIAGSDRLFVIPTSDINKVPGRGRVLKGIRPELVFATDPADAQRDPFHHWKQGPLKEFGSDELASFGQIIHPISYLPDAVFVFLRLQRAFIPPDLPQFYIEGEHITRVDYNHHTDGSGVFYSIGVPTRVYREFIDPCMVPYDRNPETFSVPRIGHDIAAAPPTVAALQRRCEERGIPIGVINFGWGSNFGGGLCNGYAPHSFPFHAWETELTRRDYYYTDNFGHLHKWHIQRRSDILGRLLSAHEQLYTYFMNCENAWSVFKAAESMDACGFSLANAGIERSSVQGDFSFGLGADLPWEQSTDFLAGSSEMTPDFVLEDLSELPANSARRREREAVFAERTLGKLEEICRLAFEYRAKGIAKRDFPILVLANGLSYALAEDTPFIIDAGKGIVWRHGQSPIIFDRLDGLIPDEVEEWWKKQVAPKLIRNPFRPPRVVSRDNYLAQLYSMGASREL